MRAWVYFFYELNVDRKRALTHTGSFCLLTACSLRHCWRHWGLLEAMTRFSLQQAVNYQTLVTDWDLAHRVTIALKHLSPSAMQLLPTYYFAGILGSCSASQSLPQQ